MAPMNVVNGLRFVDVLFCIYTFVFTTDVVSKRFCIFERKV